MFIEARARLPHPSGVLCQRHYLNGYDDQPDFILRHSSRAPCRSHGVYERLGKMAPPPAVRLS